MLVNEPQATSSARKVLVSGASFAITSALKLINSIILLSLILNHP